MAPAVVGLAPLYKTGGRENYTKATAGLFARKGWMGLQRRSRRSALSLICLCKLRMDKDSGLSPLFSCLHNPHPSPFLWGIWWERKSKSSAEALPSAMPVIELEVYCLGIRSSEVKSLWLYLGPQILWTSTVINWDFIQKFLSVDLIMI